MKKNVFYFVMLLSATLMMTGCDKSNEEQNYLKYADKSHAISDAGQFFYGHYYSSASNNIDLMFATDEHYIDFEMFVSNGEKKLLAGVYQPNNNLQPFTVRNGIVLDSDKKTVHTMKTATLNVKVDGDIYTIDIEGKLTDDSNVKGRYSGQLKFFDKSEDEVNNSYTITSGSSSQTIKIQSPQQTGNSTNGFILYFSSSFMVNFKPSGTSTTIPAGNYTITNATPMPTGTSSVSMNISGVSGTVKASSGSFNVQKNGSIYTITFNFTTNTTPVRTVTGSYTGAIP